MRLETPLDRNSINTGVIIEEITKVLSSLGIDEKNKEFQSSLSAAERNKKFQEIVQSIVKELFRRGYITETVIGNNRIPLMSKEKTSTKGNTLEDIAREVLKMEKGEDPVEVVKGVKPAEEEIAREYIGGGDLLTYQGRSPERQAGDEERVRAVERGRDRSVTSEVQRIIYEGNEDYRAEFGEYPRPEIIKSPDDLAYALSNPDEHRIVREKILREMDGNENQDSDTSPSEERTAIDWARRLEIEDEEREERLRKLIEKEKNKKD